MEHYSENLLPYIIGLENELQTNPGKLTLNTIYQTQERLHSITQHLNNIRNSYLAVNRVNPDILYNIFTVAVYGSVYPDATVLAISFVCRHWRKFVLGWPALWAFVDLRHSDSIVDLFISRSENTPLVLSWKGPPHYQVVSLGSRVDSMLSRLCSLTLHLSSSEFLQIQPAFQNSQLQPLQLRYMDIQVPSYQPSRMPPLMDILRIDTSYLRRLELRGVDLPWLVLPETKLTHLTFFPINLPPLSQLVAILASCPLLRELEFGICGGYNSESEALLNSLAYLHSLERLVLVSKNMTRLASLEYLRQLLDCIQTPKPLSRFDLSYDELWDPGYEALSFNILRPVPPCIFSHFADHHYLSISITLDPSNPGYFQILSAPEFPDDQISWSRSSYPLCLSGTCPPNRLLDRSPILDLIYAFPAITHLILGYQAREALSSWDIDIRSAFPCLNNLDLFGATDRHADASYFTDALNSLPVVGLKLKTFTLGYIGVISPKVLLDVTSKMATVEVLKLDGGYYYGEAFEEVIAVLGERGVMTLPLDRYFADVR